MSRHWLLLRGLGRDHRHWGTFVAQFKLAFPDDKVSVLDTCGNGEFATLKSPLSIAEYTDHCRLMLGESLGVNIGGKLAGTPEKSTANIHLVALSLGGMIALDWAHRFSDEVLSITLINTSAANLTPWYKRINLLAVIKSILAIVWNCNDEAIENEILQLTSNKQQHTDILARWTKYRRVQRTSLFNLIRQLIAASRFKANSLAKVTPLVLSSRADRLVNNVASKDIHRYFGGILVKHYSAGHDLPLDDGSWVISQIKQYLALS